MSKTNSKPKFKSAKQKREYEENARAWEALMAKYQPKELKNERKNLSDVYKLSAPVGRELPAIPSRVTPGGCTSANAPLKYTGDKMKGIGTMHKSNSVPIFTDDEAKDIASMRR